MDDMHHHHGKSANLLSRDGLKAYIMEFQQFAGLNTTGELDNETVKMMNMPRCGVKDKVGKNMNEEEHHIHSRSKRYALQGKAIILLKWVFRILTSIQVLFYLKRTVNFHFLKVYF